MDVVAASHVDNKVRWFSNNGAADPSFTAATILSNVDARGCMQVILMETVILILQWQEEELIRCIGSKITVPKFHKQ